MTGPKPSPVPAPLGASFLADEARHWAQPLIETLAGGFVSLYLYGSAVEPGWSPERSDVNLLLVARALPASALRALAAAWPGERLAGTHVNLVALTADQLPRSLDSFPLEIADIRARGRLLAGVDALAPLAVPPAAVRTQVERELRLIVQRLRRAFLSGRGDAVAAVHALRHAAGALAACARGIAYFTQVPVPVGAEAALAAAARWAEVEARPWLEAWRLRGEPVLPASLEILALDFLDATEALSRRVDGYGGPGA